tara:strand:- start:4223 stop:4810 length:588 start_codon:yes stop_codon:yes gene_type:complete
MCHPLAFTALGVAPGTAATLAVASNIGLAGYSIMSARAAQKSSDAFAEAKYKTEMQQIESNRESVALETLQRSNTIRDEFMIRQATNRALLSPSGIAQSNSYEAAMGFNKSAFHRELNIIALQESRKMRDLTFASIDARQQLQSTKVANKNAFRQQFIKSVTTAATAASGIKKPGTTDYYSARGLTSGGPEGFIK